MPAKRKTVQDWVKVYFKEWFVSNVEGGPKVNPSLQVLVHRHLEDVIIGTLNSILGIRVHFGEVEMISQYNNDKAGIRPILHRVLEADADKLTEMVRKLLPEKLEISLANQKRLRKAYEEKLVEALEEKVHEFAMEKAEVIARRELKSLLQDDEHIALVEGTMEEAG